MKMILNPTLAFIICITSQLCMSITHAVEDGLNRATDVAALRIQDQSIKKLQTLAKKFRGTPREPLYLSRLADIYLERSGITFRLSEGSATGAKKKLYSTALNNSVRVLSELIDRYPTDPDAPYARFKRGKAYRELEKISLAKTDYQYLRTHAKNFEYLDSALNDLADFAADASHQEESLVYLGELEQLKGSEYYPIALHKSAWAHFNLSHFEQALGYLNRESEFYFNRASKKKKMSSSDEAFLGAAFNDAALFYFEAINKKVDFASGESGVSFLLKMSMKEENGPYFGPTVLRFSKLLKAYALMKDLAQVKDEMISRFIRVPETSEVTLLLFQFQFDQKNFKYLDGLLSDLKKIKRAIDTPENEKKIDGVLSKALSDLHKLVLRNRNTEDGKTLIPALVSLTKAIVDLFGDEHASSILARYSLAETQFELKSYAEATEIYRELLNEVAIKILLEKKITEEAISLRSLSSRYQELKQMHLVSEVLTIRSIDDPFTPISKDAARKAESFGEWLLEHQKLVSSRSNEESTKPFTALKLEFLKIRYEYFDRKNAMDALTVYGKEQAGSPFGVTAMKIVLDTLSRAAQWKKSFDLTQEILGSSKWVDAAFIKNVYDLSAQSYYKLLVAEEKEAKTPEQYQAVLSKSEKCVKLFPDSKLMQDCRLMQVKLELQFGDPIQAEKSLNDLIANEKDKAKLQPLLLMRSDARAKTGKMDLANEDLVQIQVATQFKDTEITSNILQHLWFKRDHKGLANMMKDPKVCAGKNEETCARFDALKSLNQTKLKQKAIYQHIIKGPKAYAAIWALVGLRTPKAVPFNDRLNYLVRLASTWPELNPFVQIELLPTLHERVKETLSSIRANATGIAPLTSDPESVVKRLKLINEVDACFAKVMKLPWLELKLKAAEELEMLYVGLVKDLKAIETPDDLMKPFYDKVSQINEAVLTLTKMVKTFESSKIEKAHTVLLSSDVESTLPTHMWTEWKSGVDKRAGDYLFYLLSQAEGQSEDVKKVSPVIRGLILAGQDAPTEGYELIHQAPDSSMKKRYLNRFKSLKVSAPDQSSPAKPKIKKKGKE